MKKPWIGIVAAFVLVAASWIGNVWYFQAQQLGKPMFLEHYVEVIQESGDTIELYYLEDLHGDKKINTVFIPEYPEIRIESHTPNYKRYIHQQLGRIVLSMPIDSSDLTHDQASDPSIIRTVSVVFNDGSIEEVDIGEIQLINGLSDQAPNTPIKGISSGGGTGEGFDTGYTGFRISRPAQLQRIESSYISLVNKGQLELYLDYSRREKKSGMISSAVKMGDIDKLGTPLRKLVFPVQLKRSEYFRLSYRYPYIQEGADRVYRLRLRLGMEDQNRQQWTEVMFINLQPYLTGEKVRDLVRERRERI